MCCECTTKIAKFLLFLINIAVWVCGAVILGVGIALAVDPNVWDWFKNIGGSMDDDLFAAATYMMIALGSLFFVVGFLGCCGTCKGNSCLLQMYIILVSILLVLQLVCVILAIVFQSSLKDSARDEMKEVLQNDYKGINDTDAAASLSWNSMQTELKCCGAYNYTDYDGSDWQQPGGDRVPITCCRGTWRVETGYYHIKPEDKATCLNEVTTKTGNEQLFDKGCFDGLTDWVKDKSVIIIGVLAGLGAAQLLGILAACCVKSSLGDQIA